MAISRENPEELEAIIAAHNGLKTTIEESEELEPEAKQFLYELVKQQEQNWHDIMNIEMASTNLRVQNTRLLERILLLLQPKSGNS